MVVAESVTTSEGLQIPIGWELEGNESITPVSLPTPTPYGFGGEAVDSFTYDIGPRFFVGNVFDSDGGTYSVAWRETLQGEYEIIPLPTLDVGGQEGEGGVVTGPVNDTGQSLAVVGRAQTPQSQWHTVVWTIDGSDVTITDLGETFPANIGNSTANGIVTKVLTVEGVIVGGAVKNVRNE